MLHPPSHRIIRITLLSLWATLIAATLFLFLFHRDWVQLELQKTMSTSMLAAGAIYLVLGCLRGFTLIPATSLVLVGVAFFPPMPLFVLTIIGILLSSASIYLFSELLHLEEMINRRHSNQIARLKSLLQRHGLPIIIGWSFFPVTPTDLICYLCGVLRFDFKKFILGVCLGEGTICAIYIFCGDYLLRLLHFKF